jgi:hypothetical protein
MKRSQLGAFAAVACAMAVTLSAQTPPAGGAGQSPSQPPSASQPTQRSSDSNTVTVQGCLEKATPGPTGTSGAAAGASSASSAKFVLNNAMAASSSSSPTAGTSGSRPIASSYSLDGDDSKLTPHVGHKVEISGTVESARPSSPSSEPGAASSAAGGPKLKVTSVKMIASSCTP